MAKVTPEPDSTIPAEVTAPLEAAFKSECETLKPKGLRLAIISSIESGPKELWAAQEGPPGILPKVTPCKANSAHEARSKGTDSLKDKPDPCGDLCCFRFPDVGIPIITSGGSLIKRLYRLLSYAYFFVVFVLKNTSLQC